MIEKEMEEQIWLSGTTLLLLKIELKELKMEMKILVLPYLIS